MTLLQPPLPLLFLRALIVNGARIAEALRTKEKVKEWSCAKKATDITVNK